MKLIAHHARRDRCRPAARLPAAVRQGTSPAAPHAGGGRRAAREGVFAGGCFWCVEADFDKVDGVLSTTSGYTGGNVANPTYEQVSAKRTGHAEAVEIVFDPKKVSYDKLVEKFWRTIDPTTKDRQFCDGGTPVPHGDLHPRCGRSAASRRPRGGAGEEQAVQGADRHRDRAGRARSTRPRNITRTTTKNPVRYNFYRLSCGRDARLKELWGGGGAH